jgi:hypothetical protein
VYFSSCQDRFDTCPNPTRFLRFTCRTVQGRLLLRPSRKINDIILGVKGVLAQEPTSLPSQVKHSPAPCCHAKSTQKKKAFKELYRRFLDAFRTASDRLRSGMTLSESKFPEHCFPPPMRYFQTRILLPSPG